MYTVIFLHLQCECAGVLTRPALGLLRNWSLLRRNTDTACTGAPEECYVFLFNYGAHGRQWVMPSSDEQNGVLKQRIGCAENNHIAKPEKRRARVRCAGGKPRIVSLSESDILYMFERTRAAASRNTCMSCNYNNVRAWID
jgi:hypothetical protein